MLFPWEKSQGKNIYNAVYQQKGYNMATNDSRTRAFDTTAKRRKNYKSKKRIRQQIVISIFAVIALILVVFATLIIGKIIITKKEGNPPVNPPSIPTVPREAASVHMGNLLLINDEYRYSLPADLSDMINVYQYRRIEANKELTQINGKDTYTLTYDTIYLNQATLDAFNKMILDYCRNEEIVGASDKSASNLEVAWGGYTESTRDEYATDIEKYGKDYYDHALGTTLTLKINSPSTIIKHSNFEEKVNWIYNNAYRYGFVLRYPNGCENHTNLNSNTRIHLRYVGVEHATFIFNKGICLDEYLELIRNQHGYDNPLEINCEDGKIYQVYYVAYSGNPTSIPVPKDKNYYISGDNMNGFIVTVEK